MDNSCRLAVGKLLRMSSRDLWIRDLVTSYGSLLLVLIFLAILISRRWPSFRKRILRAHLTGFEVECSDLMAAYKKRLFASLRDVVSSDSVLRSMGCIRLLEIGVKTGENIQFYPDSTHLIGVDRNLKLAEYLMKGSRSWQFSHIIIERLIVGDGSSLKEVATGCVDVVVTTRSLCSVASLQSTIKEIHRVLAQGGQYLFVEHVPENEGTFVRWLQTGLTETGIWPSLFGGCQLNVNPIRNIKMAGFSNVTWNELTLGGYGSQSLHLILSRQHVLGVAVK